MSELLKESMQLFLCLDSSVANIRLKRTEVQKSEIQELLQFKLYTDQELFDKAYAHNKEYYWQRRKWYFFSIQKQQDCLKNEKNLCQVKDNWTVEYTKLREI